jgi:hypothetical protein
VDVERRLIGPALQQRQAVGIQNALKYLELLAAGLLRALDAALFEGLREFGAFAWDGGDADHETYGHDSSPLF